MKRQKRTAERAPEAAPVPAVVGAATPEELADQARAEVERAKAEKSADRYRTKKRVEQEAAEHDLAARRWARRCRIVYGVWARVAGDPAIALNESEAQEMGLIHADFALAWGIPTSNKIEATLDVLAVHGAAVATRSRAVRALMEAEEKPEPKVN